MDDHNAFKCPTTPRVRERKGSVFKIDHPRSLTLLSPTRPMYHDRSLHDGEHSINSKTLRPTSGGYQNGHNNQLTVCQQTNLAPKKIFGFPLESRLVVVGMPAVGKSAIVVRLLTGRFIWEYDPTLEEVYRYRTTVDEEPALIEVLDTAGVVDSDTEVKETHAKWGDGFLIVYSLTDRRSFEAVPEIHACIAGYKNTPNFPCALLANKADLVHSSEVTEEESAFQASELGVSFFSVSASQGSPGLSEAFTELHQEVTRKRSIRRKRSSAKVVIDGIYKIFSR